MIPCIGIVHIYKFGCFIGKTLMTYNACFPNIEIHLNVTTKMF